MDARTPWEWDRRRNSASRGIGRRRKRNFTLKAVENIMFKALPAGAVIPKVVKDMVEQCLTEFIAFIARRANQKRNYDRRPMITADDMIWAMADLRFRDYVFPLQIYQHRYQNRPQENEPEPEREMEMEMLMEPEASTSGTPAWLLPHFGDDECPNSGILGIGTAENLQNLPSLILRRLY